MTVYRIIASLQILLGATLDIGIVWSLADVLMGFMALINLPVIVILGKYALAALQDYVAQKQDGRNPVFLASDIHLPDKTDYWNTRKP